MESLRKLEKVQRMLSWMQTHDLSTNQHDSDRFLGDFLLFMAKPCGTLNMEEKCHLISEKLPKISPEVLEKALLCLTGEDCQQNFAQNPTELCVNNESNLGSSKFDIEDMAMVGLDAMQRANSTLEDFCRSYFMFHGMDVNRPQLLFRHLPVLSFTESYIYQLDSLNEEILNLSAMRVASDACKEERNRRLTDHFMELFKTDPFRPLILLLEHHGLLTERIRAELRCGEEYWVLERKLCHALSCKSEILIEDVMRAIHLKSFDYRVLNLLLYQLREKQVNDTFMEYLSISEFLVEISDDLFDYEDDVLENNFNILRMFVGIYGASMASVMLAKVITEAEQKYEHLSKMLDPELATNYQRRCEEATKEGGSKARHSLGTWSIPPVIVDEELYRSNLSNSKQLASPS